MVSIIVRFLIVKLVEYYKILKVYIVMVSCLFYRLRLNKRL